MQKADSNCSARTGADSEQKDEDIFVSQHSSKPQLAVRPIFILSFVIHLTCSSIFLFRCFHLS